MVYQGYQDYFDKKVIISVATTGGHHGKEANPNLPEQPEEVIQDLQECEEAGASIVHLHARDEDGNPTKDVSRFQELRDRIDEHCDMLVNITTGGSKFSREERIQPILEMTPKPELATLDMGPLNLGPERTAENTREQCESYAKQMREYGIKPELEVFNPGQFNEVNNLIKKDLVDEPYWLTLILGMQTGTIPHPRNLINLVDNLPENAEWQCLGIGKHQLPLTTMALILGGHVRVGLEDNIYYSKGELAESNAQLVRRAACIAEELQRPIASTADVKGILDI